MNGEYNKEDIIDGIVQKMLQDMALVGTSETQLRAICNRYLEVREESIYSAFFIQSDAAKGWSVKTGNVVFKFRECIADIFSMSKNVRQLKGDFTIKNIGLVINIISNFFRTITIQIDETCCKIVLALHSLDAYRTSVDLHTINWRLKELGYGEMTEDELREGLTKLSDIDSVFANEEERYLLNEIVCCPLGNENDKS